MVPELLFLCIRYFYVATVCNKHVYALQAREELKYTTNGHKRKNGFIPRDSDVGLSELPDHLRLHSNHEIPETSSEHHEQQEVSKQVRKLTLTVKSISTTNDGEKSDLLSSSTKDSLQSPKILTVECMSSLDNIEQVLPVQPVTTCHAKRSSTGNTTAVQLESPTEALSAIISPDTAPSTPLITENIISVTGKDIKVSQEEMDALISLTSGRSGSKMKRSISDQGHPITPFEYRRISTIEIAAAASSMTSLREETAEDVKLLTRLSNSLDHLIELESAGVDCELDQVTELCTLLNNDVLESVEIERFLETAESVTLSTHSLCESCCTADAYVSTEEIDIAQPEEVCQLQIRVEHPALCDLKHGMPSTRNEERIVDENG